MKKPQIFKLLMCGLFVFLCGTVAAQVTVRGTVTDVNGALPGATIAVKGHATAVISGSDGSYAITVPDGKAVLVFSFMGYTTQEIAVNGRAVIDVTLKETVSALDEVVVVGYGTQKKRDLTGAVSSVKVAEMPVQTYSTISHALAGKAAGMQVSQASAQPGGKTKFRIRGETSTGAGNEPLIIIDGFPVSRTAEESSGDIGVYNGIMDNMLESINPNDIESIEVLKDASATAIYGSRAGHGVIIVTTKRGKDKKINLTYSGNVSVQQISRNYDMLDAKEYMVQRNTALYEEYLRSNALDVYAGYVQLNPGHVVRPFVPKYSDRQISRVEGTDWLDEISRIGVQQSHNLSMTGGNETTRYLASVNYFDQEGIIKNDDMNRFTARFNLDQKISRFVKAGVTLSLSRNQYHNIPMEYGTDALQQRDGVIRMAVQFNPTLPVIDPTTGDYTVDPDRPIAINPVSQLNIVDNSTKDRMLGMAYVEVEPITGLTLRASLGADRRNSKRKVYLPKTTRDGAQVNGKANISESDNLDYLMDVTATWTKEIGAHNFTALAGYSWQGFNSEGELAGNQDFILDAFLYNNLGLGAFSKPSVGSWASKSAVGSYFARVNYSFLGRYLLTATLRADGASNFNPDYRWGYFPSASLGWRFTDEAFMQPFTSWLSNGKLRVSYGQTGNSNIGNQTLDVYTVNGQSMNFGSGTYAIGLHPTRLGNPQLRWETTTELNIGLDLGFFDGRINVTAEYYDRVISDLLSSKNLMSYYEIMSIAANIGKTQGQGVELTINTVNLKNKDFEWSTDLTWSFYRDRWLERDPEWKPAIYESATDPIRASWTMLSDGILQAGETAPAHQPLLLPGQVKIKDLSGPDGVPDGMLNNYDFVYQGSRDPAFYFGINNTVRYKDFDLNVYFYGEVNRLAAASYYEGGSHWLLEGGQNVSTYILGVWRHDNQSSTSPSLFYSAAYGTGDYYAKKVSYIRCRNITLGYTLPLSKKILQRARVYVDVNNPFVITNWTGLDPETDLGTFYKHEQGATMTISSAYPNIRSFSFGVDITF
ncbi:MAG: TonB-dependent receptor [Prevotellaceae bacterium]|jgi:TonB-linked SusC/RagA family outer membrane protein|nr:TonB-dependent receptor [Prevotellaceae bacterium]